MAEIYLEVLKAFRFTEMQAWIAVISAVLFSSNLLGGILSALTFVNSKRLQPRPLKERISFRLFMLSEVILLIFIFFYHVFMIESIELTHVIYWISAVMMLPLLAVIGSQLIQVAYSGKMKAKTEALERRERTERKKRRQDMDGAPSSGTSRPARPAGAGQSKERAEALAKIRNIKKKPPAKS